MKMTKSEAARMIRLGEGKFMDDPSRRFVRCPHCGVPIEPWTRFMMCPYCGKAFDAQKATEEKDAKVMDSSICFVRCPHCGESLEPWADFIKCPNCKKIVEIQAARKIEWEKKKKRCNEAVDVRAAVEIKPKKKEKGAIEMKWLKKLMRRAIIVWCLWGLMWLVVVLNPYICKLSKLFDTILPGAPLELSDRAHIALGWFYIVLALGIVICIRFFLYILAQWLFNEKDD